jgi:hypothetical protein
MSELIAKGLIDAQLCQLSDCTYCMKVNRHIRGVEGIASLILNLSSRRMWVVSLMSWLPYPTETAPQHPLPTRLHGPQSQSASLREQEDLLFLTGFEPDHPASNQSQYRLCYPDSTCIYCICSHFTPRICSWTFLKHILLDECDWTCYIYGCLYSWGTEHSLSTTKKVGWDPEPAIIDLMVRQLSHCSSDHITTSLILHTGLVW